MAVFRIEKTRDYTVMSNYHLRDMSLSLKAKGLLSLMLSLPENWDYTMKGLARICKDGIDSISGGIRELEAHGYLIRSRVRSANGQLGSIEYTILEQPKAPSPTQEKPIRENPVQANPMLDAPIQENPAQLNKEESSNYPSKTDLSIIESLLLGRGLSKGSDYDRETGKFEFSGKEYIPDFIIPKLQLCIEVKLLRDGRKSKVIEEISADITAYAKQYERQLFVVYDLGVIQNEEEFRRDIENAGNVKLITHTTI